MNFSLKLTLTFYLFNYLIIYFFIVVLIHVNDLLINDLCRENYWFGLFTEQKR